MLEKNIDQITLQDIENLITNSLEEGKTLDYKKEYSLEKDPEKGEFLSDICSFLNTSGGLLIFGMEEEKGIATKITPLTNIEDADKEKLKIESLIRDGISLRASVQIKFLRTEEEGGYILIIKLEKSWKGPHRVIFTPYSKTKDQFYARNSAGKYQMDVMELKNAFTLSDTVIQKIRDFRIQRISEIVSGNTPVPLYESGKIILHIIPIDAFSPGFNININKATLKSEKTIPIYPHGWGKRINLDGVLIYSGKRSDNHDSYLQVYRTGIIESVDSALLENRGERGKIIPSGIYEKHIIEATKKYLSFLQENQINTPILIFLTLVGMKDYSMAADSYVRFSELENKIDTDIINLPEFLIQDYSEDIIEVLRPMFDLIWNACGFISSHNFTEDGKWTGGRS